MKKVSFITMKRIQTMLLGLGVFMFFLFGSCSKDSTGPIQSVDNNYLIFGHYYGFCQGETCIETYKLTSSSLYEDLADDYSKSLPFQFMELSNNQFLKVDDLMDYFPDDLRSQSDTTFGCPDCVDQGGLYIELVENGVSQKWRVDNDKFRVQVYLHAFMDSIHSRIELINQ